MSFYDAIRVGASGAGDFEVERSLRFNRGDSTYIQRTSSTGNQRTWTVSFWMKFCEVTGSTNQRLWTCDGNSGSFDMLKIEFDSGADTNRRLSVIDNNHASSGVRFVGERSFRDPSAWYHIVVAVDTTQATAANRVKIYVNNEQTTVFKSGSEHNHPPDQNYQTSVNASGKTNTWGRAFSFGSSSPDYFDGYLAEINFIDGLQLTPSSFAETNSETGQWVPIDTSGLTFGTNGYRLNFSDNSGTTATTLGKDSSGNGNNLTPNNFVTGDAVKDSPTNNFCTLNILNSQNTNFSEGNLKAEITNGSGNRTTVATMGSKSGKWYYEVLYNSQTVDALCVGFGDESYNALQGNNKLFEDHSPSVGYYGAGGGYIYFNTSRTEYSTDFTAGDIIGVAADFDNNQIYFYKNGTVHPNANPFSYTFSDTFFIPAMGNLTSGGNQTFTANFGQDSTFAGAKTAQGNTDSRGKGDFYYAPPSGFLALCSANLPDPTILLPNKHFDILLYTGNGGTQSITGLEFQPDWVWTKERGTGTGGGSSNHQLYDAVRGATKRLESSNTSDEDTISNGLTSFDSNGFSIGSHSAINDNSVANVAWNWDAGETDSATYTVKVVSDSGNKYRFNDFGTSAVTLDLAEGGTYTFDQSDSSMSSHPMQLSTTANGTHGGGSAYSTGVTYQLDGSTVTASAFISGFSSASSRKLIITVAASAPTLYYYCYYHSGMGGQANTNSTLGSSNFDGSIQTTVKVNASAGFSIVSYDSSNTNGSSFGHGLGVAPDHIIFKNRDQDQDWLNYHAELGTSKYLYLDLTSAAGTSSNWIGTSSSVFTHNNTFASSNNGSNYIAYCFSEVAGYSKFGKYTANGNNNGTFVYTGFRPALIIFKNTSATEAWSMFDNKRDPFNPVEKFLRPSATNADTSGSNDIDFLSNGFKARTSNNPNTNSGNTYIYLAFAESPFKNSRAR